MIQLTVLLYTALPRARFNTIRRGGGGKSVSALPTACKLR
uniref:Uncharacterized protein n=1 Tax=Anguilla anguilla TaxID=7936 RepID=A0A0E9R4H1_ANGAN